MVVVPIPIGVRRVATAEGTCWKFVKCIGCAQDYAYPLSAQTIGVDEDILFLDGEASRKRAQANAQRNLEQMYKNAVLPVPCPHCGLYQPDMVNLLKEDAPSNRLFTAGLVLAVLSLGLPFTDVPGIWIATGLLLLTGVLLMGFADLSARRLDPNASDPEGRKQIGRKNALWGKHLHRLVEVSQPTNANT